MKLLVVAGEVSGDQHASALLASLGTRVPALEVFGVGGDGCKREGMRLLAHQKDLAVVGRGIDEPFVQILGQRRRQHEKGGVGGAHLG